MEKFQSHMDSNLPKNVTLLLQIWTQQKLLTGISSLLNFSTHYFFLQSGRCVWIWETLAVQQKYSLMHLIFSSCFPVLAPKIFHWFPCSPFSKVIEMITKVRSDLLSYLINATLKVIRFFRFLDKKMDTISVSVVRIK